MNGSGANKYRSYEMEDAQVLESSGSESLMSQIGAAQKMAAMLCEQINQLTERLSPICRPGMPSGASVSDSLRQGQSEPAPAIIELHRLKEALSQCSNQIHAIQARLSL